MTSYVPALSMFKAAATRQHVQGSRDEFDEFLSSDLEVSFASTMSLNSPHMSPVGYKTQLDLSSPMPMDISPVAHRPSSHYGTHRSPLDQPQSQKHTTLAPPLPAAFPSGSTRSVGKKLQRAALPTEWMSPFVQLNSPQRDNAVRAQQPTVAAPDSPNAMDVDTSMCLQATHIAPSSPAPLSAAPTVTNFSNLFFDDSSPCLARVASRTENCPTKKRRSTSPERSRFMEDEHDSLFDKSSSPAAELSSPSQRRFERFASTGGQLFKAVGKPSLGEPGVGKKARRPTISALVRPESVAAPIQSAFAVMQQCSSEKENVGVAARPTRRAFSALMPTGPSLFEELNRSGSSDLSSDGPDMSSPAAQAHAKRQSFKTLRRRDGTEDFRPLTSMAALSPKNINSSNIPGLKDSPSAKFIASGIPGFGDNEAHGKILPCRRVPEDGLMRIDCATLDAVLDGRYNDDIAEYHIIDCRFDYEYAGGHIPGAINVNSTAELEDLFLNPARAPVPKPSCSGDTIKKTVLIFHCEFSAKRAPTFAKHLRSKDRSVNNAVYPRIHYPEVYVLKGGYCQYFKESADRCQPRAYVRMDDPAYAQDRREDLDQFRKARFGRTKSYAYGESMAKASSSQFGSQPAVNPKRNTAPSGGPTSLFAAASAARSRRGTISATLTTLEEDGNTTISDDEEGHGIGDSPCPPPTKNAALANKRTSRTLGRAQTMTLY